MGRSLEIKVRGSEIMVRGLGIVVMCLKTLLLEPAKLGARIVARDSKRAVFRAGRCRRRSRTVGVATVWNATQCKFT